MEKTARIYRLDSVTSRYENEIHSRITGRRCMLDHFEPGYYGMFLVELEGGFHHIRTSTVKDVQTDDAGDVIVTTDNSRYVFKAEDDTDGSNS